MNLDKKQLEVLDHFTNAIAKSFEIWQLKQALMSELIGESEISMARKEEARDEVREDLHEARVDLWDMLMTTMRSFNEMGKEDLTLENIAKEGALNENPMLDALATEGDIDAIRRKTLQGRIEEAQTEEDTKEEEVE